MNNGTRAEWIRLTSSAIFWCAIIFAVTSVATEFHRDAMIAAGVAAGAGVVWIGQLVHEDIVRQRGILAAPPPVLVPLDDVEFDDDLPWLTRGEVEDRRPHWDTDVMGAPE